VGDAAPAVTLKDQNGKEDVAEKTAHQKTRNTCVLPLGRLVTVLPTATSAVAKRHQVHRSGRHSSHWDQL
jgi:hypothetical protein